MGTKILRAVPPTKLQKTDAKVATAAVFPYGTCAFITQYLWKPADSGAELMKFGHNCAAVFVLLRM